MYIRLREAAARIYTSQNYKTRGEVGEITLHAICRDYFDTIPIAPRVFYLTSSNEVVKSFDMVHVRYTGKSEFELWLGEAKFYTNSGEAIASAIHSIGTHIGQGFLNNEKLILGPQISKHIPRYQEIRDIFSVQTSLDELFKSAVFPICILCDSQAVLKAKVQSDKYVVDITKDLDTLESQIIRTCLASKIRIMLIYLPLASKALLAASFDARLKGLQL